MAFRTCRKFATQNLNKNTLVIINPKIGLAPPCPTSLNVMAYVSIAAAVASSLTTRGCYYCYSETLAFRSLTRLLLLQLKLGRASLGTIQSPGLIVQ